MFDELFERPHAITRQRSGPLAEERLRYLHHLADQAFSHASLRVIAYYLLVICDYLNLADRDGEMISRAEIEEKAVLWGSRNLKSRQNKKLDSPYSRRRFVCHAIQWLRFLGRLYDPKSPPNQYADLVSAYADHMSRERGLSPQTIKARRWTVEEFLTLLGETKIPLREITITDIDRALMKKITDGGYARVTVQTYAGNLRDFFRYAEMRGCCNSGLSTAIKSPRVFPQERLPTGPSWNDVQRLLSTTEGDHPTDIRDRAILLLLAVYGLRAGEVVHLRLEDFDRQDEVLFVRRYKTLEAHRYPLARTVGDAVLRYLREVRPHSSHREVFLTRRPPFRPLHSGLWRIVARRLRPLGVSLRHYGPHVLRHACATHLLEQGLSLKEIGDYLGHRDPETTRIYAKVDLAGLRQVADIELGGLL